MLPTSKITIIEQCRLMPIAGLVLDTENKVIFCNILLRDLLSIDAFEKNICFTGFFKHFRLTSTRNVDDTQHIKAYLNQRAIFSLTYQNTVFEFNPATIDDNSQIIYWLHDVTHHQIKASEQLRNEISILAKKLIAAEELARLAKDAKQSFLSNMSHEMKTPLNAILGFSQLLNPENTNQKRYVAGIVDAGQVLTTLVDDILDIARFDSGKLELRESEVVLKTFLSDLFLLWQMRCQDYDIKFESSVSETQVYSVLLDASRLRQIINNLLSNAVKFSRKAGIVKIKVNIIQETESTCCLSFKIMDNGVGISQHILTQIFDTFSRGTNDLATEYAGAGLGLPLSSALVKLMKGSIKVQSELSRGSIFTVKLPEIKVFSKNTHNLINKNLTSEPVDFAILIVEDEPLNRMVLAKMASKVASKVYQAADGDEALKILTSRTVDIVVMDVDLPGMDGIEITALMSRSQQFKNIPVIACTALPVADMPSKAEIYFKYILPKPVKQAHLIETLELVLKG